MSVSLERKIIYDLTLAGVGLIDLCNFIKHEIILVFVSFKIQALNEMIGGRNTLYAENNELQT